MSTTQCRKMLLCKFIIISVDINLCENISFRGLKQKGLKGQDEIDKQSSCLVCSTLETPDKVNKLVLLKRDDACKENSIPWHFYNKVSLDEPNNSYSNSCIFCLKFIVVFRARHVTQLDAASRLNDFTMILFWTDCPAPAKGKPTSFAFSRKTKPSLTRLSFHLPLFLETIQCA